MGDVINLRQRRKWKAREQAEMQAAQNRIDFGMSQQDRQAVRAKIEADLRKLEAHQRDVPPDKPEGEA